MKFLLKTPEIYHVMHYNCAKKKNVNKSGTFPLFFLKGSRDLWSRGIKSHTTITVSHLALNRGNNFQLQQPKLGLKNQRTFDKQSSLSKKPKSILKTTFSIALCFLRFPIPLFNFFPKIQF